MERLRDAILLLSARDRSLAAWLDGWQEWRGGRKQISSMGVVF